METWLKIFGPIYKGVRIPSGADFFVNSDESRMKLYIPKPDQDLQANAAAFEGWALIFHARLTVEVIVSFTPIDDWSFAPGHGHYHYARFLYRLWKFEEQMPWFHVDVDCQGIVDKFKADLLQLKASGMVLNNLPGGNSQETARKSRERQIEKAFVYSDDAQASLQRTVLEEDGVTLMRIHDQLPIGLFRDSISEENRLFMTGFIDLWAVGQQNELCIFELKIPSNRRVGIIPELFFYANYCRDFVTDGCLNELGAGHRGYHELLTAVREGVPRIKAYFLAPKYHSRIEGHMTEIESCLNMNSPAIDYRFLRYDYERIKDIADQIGAL
ncbi:MAG: hypothetical protein GX033_00565 [Firmicutes bacterium]|nr:hypothetical protein [Bacillota bacterium]